MKQQLSWYFVGDIEKSDLQSTFIWAKRRFNFVKWQDTLVSQWLNLLRILCLLTLTTSWTVWTARHLSWSAWPGSVPTAPLCVACFFTWCGLSLIMRVQSGTPAPRLTVFVSNGCTCLWHGQFSVWVVALCLRRTFWSKLEGQPWLGGVAVTSCSFCGNFEWTWASVSSRKHVGYCRRAAHQSLRRKIWRCPCAARREGASQSFLPSSIALWNKLPDSVTSCTSSCSFLASLDSFYDNDRYSFGLA